MEARCKRDEQKQKKKKEFNASAKEKEKWWVPPLFNAKRLLES